MARIARRVVVAVVAAIALAATALAQPSDKAKKSGSQDDRRARESGGVGGWGLWGLVQNEAVQKELKLHDAQLKWIADTRAEFQSLGIGAPAAKRGSDADHQARDKTIQDKVKGLQDRVKEVLDPGQLARLEEISLQVRLAMQGIVALDDPQLVESLGITDQQRQQLRALNEELRRKHREEHPRFDPQAWRALSDAQRQARRAERHKLAEKLRQQAMQEAVNVLSPEQKAKLDKLQGRPFAIDQENVEKTSPPKEEPPGKNTQTQPQSPRTQ